IYGKTGSGVAEELGCQDEIDLIMGTFSKALGSIGGFVVGSKILVEFLLNFARSFAYSTAVPPMIAAVNQVAMNEVQKMNGQRLELRKRSEALREEMRGIGLNVLGKDSPILPVVVGDALEAMRMSEALNRQGIIIPSIRPPSVPADQSLLRMSLTSLHTKD